MRRSDPCRKLRRLRRKETIGSLTPFEEQWCEQHLRECPECGEEELAGKHALEALRNAASEVEVSAEFDANLVRRIRLDKSVRTFAYWSPAFVGAALAGIAALALVQVLSSKPAPRPPLLEGREAKRSELPVIPDPGFTIAR